MGAGDRFNVVKLHACLASAEVTDDVDTFARLLGELFATDPATVLDSPLALATGADQRTPL